MFARPALVPLEISCGFLREKRPEEMATACQHLGLSGLDSPLPGLTRTTVGSSLKGRFLTCTFFPEAPCCSKHLADRQTGVPGTVATSAKPARGGEGEQPPNRALGRMRGRTPSPAVTFPFTYTCTAVSYRAAASSEMCEASVGAWEQDGTETLHTWPQNYSMLEGGQHKLAEYQLQWTSIKQPVILRLQGLLSAICIAP